MRKVKCKRSFKSVAWKFMETNSPLSIISWKFKGEGRFVIWLYPCSSCSLWAWWSRISLHTNKNNIPVLHCFVQSLTIASFILAQKTYWKHNFGIRCYCSGRAVAINVDQLSQICSWSWWKQLILFSMIQSFLRQSQGYYTDLRKQH